MPPPRGVLETTKLSQPSGMLSKQNCAGPERISPAASSQFSAKVEIMPATASPFHAEDRVAPRRLALYRVPPEIRNARPAHKPKLPVDDQQLAMRALIQALPRVPAQRMVPAHLAAGRAQRVEIPVRRLVAADGIDDGPHLHPRPRPFRQRLQNLPRDSPRDELVVLQVDRGGVRCE